MEPVPATTRSTWRTALTTWAIGTLGIIAIAAVMLGGLALLGLEPGTAAGRLALSLGLATFISVLLTGAVRLPRLQDPLPVTTVVGILHVITFLTIFAVDMLLRLIAGTDGPAPLNGTIAEQAGPASAIVAIMSIAAIAASMLALSTTPTEDERAHGTFG